MPREFEQGYSFIIYDVRTAVLSIRSCLGGSGVRCLRRIGIYYNTYVYENMNHTHIEGMHVIRELISWMVEYPLLFQT